MNVMETETQRPAWLAKLRTVVNPGEPVWLVKEEINPDAEMIYLTVVSRWGGTWMRRRYTYDIVGNVLHFRGQLPLSHEEYAKLKPEQLLKLDPEGEAPFAG